MGEPIKPEVQVFNNLKNASHALGENIVKTASDEIEKKGRFVLALGGGKTPRFLYNLLASRYSSKIRWEAVHLFWGDERCVPRDHPESNFAMAYHALISRVPLPLPNIHRIPADAKTPERAAESYEKILREFFKDSEGEGFQTFDVILLGMGKDGHTASLFPRSSALGKKSVGLSRWMLLLLFRCIAGLL